ncbi:MAG: GHKL domain-containing protein, partial [Ruminococcus sp.]|nr:GHKL domain-containing protein [Ruminococcus sp.]
MLNTAFVIFSVSFLLYKAKPNPAIIFNLLFFILLILCETLAAAVLALNREIPFHTLLAKDDEMILGYLMNTVIIFGATRILILLLSKQAATKIGYNEILILVFMTVFESYIIHSAVMHSFSADDVLIIVVIILGFIAMNIFVVFEVHQISKLMRIKYESDIIKQQNALQLSHYSEMKENYDHYRKIVHDLRKHMNILAALNDDEHHKEYARTINEKMDMLFDEYETKCPILSIIMTQKIRAAKNNGIKLIMRMEDIDLSFISDTDITSIFANLWDNALEACETVDSEERLINITLVKKGELIIIQFENSFDGKVLTAAKKSGETEHFLTTKDESHAGLGLQIIKSAAEKYNG